MIIIDIAGDEYQGIPGQLPVALSLLDKELFSSQVSVFHSGIVYSDMIGLSQYNKDCAGIYGVPANIITYFIKHKTLMFYHKHYLQRLCTRVVSSFKKGVFKHYADSFNVQVLHKQV